MSALRVASYVRIEHFGKHSAVLLQVLPQHYIVAYHTTTERAGVPCEVVPWQSSDGRRFGLDSDSYFYLSCCVVKRVRAVEYYGAMCGPALFLRLRQFFQAQIARLDRLTSAELDVEIARDLQRRGAPR